MRVAVYGPTGQIERIVSCSESQVAANVEGYEWIEVDNDISDDTHYVQAGAPVPLPARPSSLHTWDWASKAWRDPELVVLRATRWAALKRQRDQAEYGGFTWDGSVFDSDLVSQSRIQGASQMATLAASQAQPFTIDWTLADNTVRTLSGAEMISLGMALGQHIENQHAKGRLLRGQLMAATAAGDVSAVTW